MSINQWKNDLYNNWKYINILNIVNYQTIDEMFFVELQDSENYISVMLVRLA
jgi:hypothetical protein